MEGTAASRLPLVAVSQSYLPGSGDTVIKQAVLPRRGLAIALRRVDPCDSPKCGELGSTISDSGDCVRALPLQSNQKIDLTKPNQHRKMILNALLIEELNTFSRRIHECGVSLLSADFPYQIDKSKDIDIFPDLKLRAPPVQLFSGYGVVE